MNKELSDLLKSLYYTSDLKDLISNQLKEEKQSFLVDYCVSSKCNLICRHCYMGDYKRNTDNNLSHGEWQDIIDTLIRAGIRHHHFSGRESSLSPVTTDLLKHISKSCPDKYLGIITNGHGKKEYYDKAYACLDYLEISLDGLQEGHDYIRGPGSFEKVWDTLGYFAREYDTDKLNVTTSLCKANSCEYTSLLKEVSGLGIKKFFVNTILPNGFGKEMETDFLSADNLGKLIEQIYQFLSQNTLEIIVKCCIPQDMIPYFWHESKLVRQFFEKALLKGEEMVERINGNYLELAAPFIEFDYLSQLCISFDGEVYSCPNDIAEDLEFSLGNIRDEGVFGILKKRNYLLNEQLNTFLS